MNITQHTLSWYRKLRKHFFHWQSIVMVHLCTSLDESVLVMPQAGIVRTTIHTIIHKILEYCILCCRSIPKVLTNNHETLRISSALTFLAHYRDVGQPSLNAVVMRMRHG